MPTPTAPWLTVITPVLNKRAYLLECLESVTRQACPGVEHIVADGLSTDGTVELLREYAATHPHVRWFSEKDTGQSDAMNKAIARARGAALGVLNADDYYEPGTLQRVRDLFPRLPTPSLLVGDCKVWGEGGRFLYVNRPIGLNHHNLLMARRMPCNPSAYFYHRAIHDLAGPYDPGEHYAMDLLFLVGATRVAHVTYVPEHFGNFRLIEGTKTLADQRSGGNNRRFEEILRRARAALPPGERLVVEAGFRATQAFYPVLSKIYQAARRGVARARGGASAGTA